MHKICIKGTLFTLALACKPQLKILKKVLENTYCNYVFFGYSRVGFWGVVNAYYYYEWGEGSKHLITLGEF